MRSAWLVVLVIAGCPGREPANPSLVPADTKQCDGMADHVVRAVMAGDGAANDTVDALRHALAERCATDRWSVDAQQCYAAAREPNDLDGCAPLLTVDQREAFAKAIGDAVGKPPVRRGSPP